VQRAGVAELDSNQHHAAAIHDYGHFAKCIKGNLNLPQTLN
jgi:hypothetical protein